MTQKIKRSLPELPFDEIVDCPVVYLTLDYNNPRFEIDFDQKRDTEIDAIRTLCNISDIKELIDSISDNGYLPIEPMIVYKGPSQSKYVVLEGNRRLSALKILRDEKIARELRMSVPKLDVKKLRTTENIKVFRVKNPLDARAYIGFKHINGPQRWDAYAKAKFATKWYKDFRKEGKTIEDVARQLGDNNDTVRSYVSSVLVLEQAEKNDIITSKRKPARENLHFLIYTQHWIDLNIENFLVSSKDGIWNPQRIQFIKRIWGNCGKFWYTCLVQKTIINLG
jgi:hypothetical protein